MDFGYHHTAFFLFNQQPCETFNLFEPEIYLFFGKTLDAVPRPTYNRMQSEVSGMELFLNDLTVSDVRIAIFVPPGQAKRVHTNRISHGLAFNVGTCATYRFDSGLVLKCLPGQCIYLPRGSNYTVDPEEVSEAADTTATPGVYCINFRLLDDPVDPEPLLIKIRGRDKALSCFERAESAWRKKNIGYREDCFSALYQLLRLFRREHASYAQLATVMNKLATALQYIEARYTSENIQLSALAQLCGFSEPYLRKLFNIAFSVSPSNYIRNMRINYAKELLCTGEYSITSVAALAGFNSVVYFSREFKKATGVPPNKYIP